jgi:hypothetical protein
MQQQACEKGWETKQSALRSVATIKPMNDELRVTLAPLGSQHRSKAIAARTAKAAAIG